jgi:uncharacterized membrane-anchored protein
MAPMRGSGIGGWLYVAIVAAVAAMAFYPAHPEPWLFWLVFLLTMPISLAVVQVHLVIAALSDGGGWVTSTVVVLLWVGTALGQMFAFRAMVSSWSEARPHASS